MQLIDAHCHLANLSEVKNLRSLMEEASRNGISRFVSSALRSSEVDHYLQNHYENLIFSAGIHPNFDECDLDLDLIDQLAAAKRIWAIGEIGLDRGNPDFDAQYRLFMAQLELAVKHSLPAVLHIVGHQQQAYELLREYDLKYLVHGYAGSVEGFELLARLNSVFTISSRILHPDKSELLKRMVAHGRILFETDITQYYVKAGESNPLLRLLEVFDNTQQLSGSSQEELLRLQDISAKQLFGDLP